MRLTEEVHQMLKEVLRPGDTAIDATAGNGHDTLGMAKRVAASGKVFAIDLQAAAMAATNARLETAGCLERCKLLKGDHAEVLKGLLPHYRESIAAITFNLGYLPGGSKDITTLPDSTLRALELARDLLRKSGALLVTAYRGHPGGREEAAQVESWMRSLPEQKWTIEAREPATRDPARIPPVLWIARKTD